MATVKLYHATTPESAASIMANGFSDPAEPWRAIQQVRNGTFFSDVPILAIDGAKGQTVIEVEIDATPEEMFLQFEIIDGRNFREFIIPAIRINACPRRILSTDEIEAATLAGGWNEYPPGEPQAWLAQFWADDELDD